jgi:serine protease Do
MDSMPMNKISTRARFLGAVAVAFACGLLFAAGFDLTPFGYAQNRVPAVNLAAPLPAVADASTGFASIAERVTPAVVYIEAESDARQVRRGRAQQPDVPSIPGFPGFDFGQPDDRPSAASGSGFIVSADGYVLTNNHVVTRDDHQTVADRVHVRLPDGRSFQAKIIGHDPETDVAVLKIDGSNLPVAVLGDDNNARVGEWVLAIGNPFGRLDFTVTAGIVSAKGRSQLDLNPDMPFAVSDFIQTDAAINPGNSGGPLVNTRGEVIGINSAIASQTGYYAGYGFAIPITLAKEVMDDLVKYGRVRAGMLGVQIGEVKESDAHAAGLKAIKGVLVEGFPTDGASPAKAAGIEPGDVIVAADGKEVDRVSQLQRMVRTHEPGEAISLSVMRYGESKTFSVKIAERPSDDIVASTSRGNRPSSPDNVSYDKVGISVSQYPGPVQQRTGRGLDQGAQTPVVVDLRGLMVTDVSADGPANGLLFPNSDVIVQVLGPGGKKDITSEADLRTVLAKLRPGDYLSLYVRSVAPNAGSSPYRVVNLTLPK